MRPTNREEYLNITRLFIAERSQSNKLEVKEDTYRRARQVYMYGGIPELFCGELTAENFVHAVTEEMSKAPDSYRTHGVKTYLIPLAAWLGILSFESEVRWRRGIKKYVAKKPISERIPSGDEMRATMEWVKAHHDRSDINQCRNDAAIATMLVTGCRRAQLSALKVGTDVLLTRDNNMEYLTFRFITQKERSNRKYHIVSVPMHIEVAKGMLYADLMYDWLNIRLDNSEWFFHQENGKRVFPQVWKMLTAAVTQAATGIPRTPHSFRAYAVTLVANTVGIDAARKLAGHTSIVTTMKYHDPWRDTNTRSTLEVAFAQHSVPELTTEIMLSLKDRPLELYPYEVPENEVTFDDVEVVDNAEVVDE